MLWDSTGCCSLENFVGRKLRGQATESFCNLLCALRRVAEAVAEASDYLVDYHAISLKPEDIYFSDTDGKARLLPGHTEGRFIDALCGIAAAMHEKIPACNGDLIANKLKDADAQSIMNIKGILKFLSGWEIELRS